MTWAALAGWYLGVSGLYCWFSDGFCFSAFKNPNKVNDSTVDILNIVYVAYVAWDQYHHVVRVANDVQVIKLKQFLPFCDLFSKLHLYVLMSSPLFPTGSPSRVLLQVSNQLQVLELSLSINLQPRKGCPYFSCVEMIIFPWPVNTGGVGFHTSLRCFLCR